MSQVAEGTVDSPVGRRALDSTGSPVGVVRLDPGQAYRGIPELLKDVIDEANESSWGEIQRRIDYIYDNLGHALTALDGENGFAEEVKSRVRNGKKLLFKPNLVMPRVIDPVTHGAGLGDTACTPWPFVAAVMRWFHDTLEISYHDMTVGEAASTTSVTAGAFGLSLGGDQRITTEAVIEGRCGDFYGGWGFYFARKYLAATHAAGHEDDPMNGYEESISGQYFPPGRAGKRLMVYDLNRLNDVASKPREVSVPEGANFQRITLHKAIIGGDPQDPDDMRDYPGSVLINLPKLKMHSLDLLTNAVKNLGIGLYPMEVSREDGPDSTRWKYASPFNRFPTLKSELPHTDRVAKLDSETGLPVRDDRGEYVVTKTAGMSGTQADVIRATANQDVFMLHVIDAIEPTNVDHTGSGRGVLLPEGYVMASTDPVAVDELCARHCFKMVPMVEARQIRDNGGPSTEFMQRAPIPRVDGRNIVSDGGFDSPLPRYSLFSYAEGRGLGQRLYHVAGWDAEARAPLATLDGHLGRVEGGAFSELITPHFYFNPGTLLWDLQKTVLGYLEANDRLTGSSYLAQMLEAFDENGDGVIDYDEKGKNGATAFLLRSSARAISSQATEKHGSLRGSFLSIASQLKYSDAAWNTDGHDFTSGARLTGVCALAFALSQVPAESEDPLFPGMTWGKGKWPSVQLASRLSIGMAIYGPAFPAGAGPASLFGLAFQYADKALNRAQYTGSDGPTSAPNAVPTYLNAVSAGAAPLDFVLHVPRGYGSLAGAPAPNVRETDDPARMFTAEFGRSETW
jgi:hypothetical protein